MYLSQRTLFLPIVSGILLWLTGSSPIEADQKVVIYCGTYRMAPPTLGQQSEQADIVLQVAWKNSRQGAVGDKGETLYEVTRIAKGNESTLKIGDQLELPGFLEGVDGDTYFLTGKQGASINWGAPQKVTGEAFQYVAYLSSHRFSYEQRLLYFFNYLEHEDEQIAKDAYQELTNASYEVLLKVREQIPRTELRRWISDPQTVRTRLGWYGLLLGICGDSQDAAALLKIINQPTREFRQELMGVMSGYLLITGAEGLEMLETLKLKDKDAPFSDTYATMQAMRYLWKYAPGSISKDRLRKSMRSVLDRADLADLAIGDLIRWEDWQAVDRMIDMYEDETYNKPSIKRAIIRYLTTYQKASEENPDNSSFYTFKADAALEYIRKEDPKLYKDALRFFRF